MNTLMYRSEYAKMYRSEDKLWWYCGLRDTLKFYLTKHTPLDAAILDAGCGTGKNMEFFTTLGYTNVQGFDYSADAIEFCKQRGLEQAEQGNIIAIQRPDESFDMVCCMDVLGSLEPTDNILAVNELCRVLKPGGIIICNTAALELFRSQHDDVANIKTRFTKPQFKKLFEKEGATILKLSYKVFLLSPLILLFKLIKRITGLFNTPDQSKSDQLIFPFGINWCLLQIQLLENRLFRKIDFPFGSSVFIVVRKNN
jgi:2-polyprenyl-3-methyl-5-hydroxy-6-metoxy-1,4-benzoquinol methylase